MDRISLKIRSFKSKWFLYIHIKGVHFTFIQKNLLKSTKLFQKLKQFRLNFKAALHKILCIQQTDESVKIEKEKRRQTDKVGKVLRIVYELIGRVLCRIEKINMRFIEKTDKNIEKDTEIFKYLHDTKRFKDNLDKITVFEATINDLQVNSVNSTNKLLQVLAFADYVEATLPYSQDKTTIHNLLVSLTHA